MLIVVIPAEGQLTAADRHLRNVVGVAAGETDEAAFQRAGSGAADLQPPGAVSRFVDGINIPAAVELFVAGEGWSRQKEQEQGECMHRFLAQCTKKTDVGCWILDVGWRRRQNESFL